MSATKGTKTLKRDELSVPLLAGIVNSASNVNHAGHSMHYCAYECATELLPEKLDIEAWWEREGEGWNLYSVEPRDDFTPLSYFIPDALVIEETE